jgi:hypothetical protein
LPHAGVGRQRDAANQAHHAVPEPTAGQVPHGIAENVRRDGDEHDDARRHPPGRGQTARDHQQRRGGQGQADPGRERDHEDRQCIVTDEKVHERLHLGRIVAPNVVKCGP